MDIELDQEALDIAYTQINYYSNLPKHIKYSVSKYLNTKVEQTEESKPALMLKEKASVFRGKINFPTLTEINEFHDDIHPT